jgi:hypothetical protein
MNNLCVPARFLKWPKTTNGAWDKPTRGGWKRGSPARFDVFQASVEHFFDAVQFGAPEIAHVIEAAVDGIEASVLLVESRVDVGDDKANQRCAIRLPLVLAGLAFARRPSILNCGGSFE